MMQFLKHHSITVISNMGATNDIKHCQILPFCLADNGVD